MQPPVSVNRPLAALLCLIKFLIPYLLIDPAFELQRDEFLYFQQALHPAFGYLENPPLLSWLGAVSALFGRAEWAVKFWPALMGSLTLLLTMMITARLGGKTFAQFLAGFGLLAGAYLRIHILYQPNILDIFFWTLATYFLLLFIQTSNWKYWLFLVLACALGWWSKYSVLFLAAGIIGALVLTPHRRVFRERKTYLFMIAGVLLILPNLLWQYFHNWPLYHHMQELRETQLVFISPVAFIIDQFLMLLPVLIIWTGGFIFCIRHKELRIFSILFVLVIGFILLGSGKNYYTLGIYPFLLAAGGLAWQTWTSKKMGIRILITALVILMNIAFLPLMVPFTGPDKLAGLYQRMGVENSGILKWEDQQDHALPQDFADMLGWKELAEKAQLYYTTLPSSIRKETVVYCRNYGQAGALKFYGTDKQFRGRVFSDNGSFLLWIPDSLQFRHLLFIGRREPDNDDVVFQQFEGIKLIDSVQNPLSRQFGDRIIFYSNANDTASAMARQGLNEMKNRFRLHPR